MDIIDVTILDDGSIKIETDKISPANHVGADALVKTITEKLGGKMKIQPKGGKAHHHHHEHEHKHH